MLAAAANVLCFPEALTDDVTNAARLSGHAESVVNRLVFLGKST